jgi:hypothetical protein
MLMEMAGEKNKDNTVLFPGISVVYTQEAASCEIFKWEHKSRSSL